MDVDVATLRPFRQFLYPGPPCASKIGLILEIPAFLAVKVRPVRQKFRSSSESIYQFFAMKLFLIALGFCFPGRQNVRIWMPVKIC